MFCIKKRTRQRNAATLPSSIAASNNNTSSSVFITDNHQPQHYSYPSNSSNQQGVICPISFYPDNVYGQGLETGLTNRVDTRSHEVLDGPTYYVPIRDPSVPIPPGVVVVQVIQPSAPYFPPQLQPQQRPQYYPRLSPMDQDYANQEMALQK